MAKYIHPLQKRATTSAIICALSVAVAGVLSISEGNLGTIEKGLLLISIAATVVSFTLLLVYSVRYSQQHKKDSKIMISSPTTPSVNSQSYAPSTPIFASVSDLNLVDSMAGLEFEHWCADLLCKNSFTNVTVTQASGDQGVDILAEKDGIRYAIQCKCYSSDLGNTPVQEVNAGKEFYHCHVGAVMTNQHFTTGAKALAAATGVLLWDRDWIQERLPKDITASQSDADIFITALAVVIATQQASISMLQKRLNIGYAHAARLIDTMEEKGYIGPFAGSKPREIFITEDQWQTLRLDTKK